MTDARENAPRIPFPTRDEPDTNYVARSGGVVRLYYIDDGKYGVRLDDQPGYSAVILRDGSFYELIPAPGVIAVRGTGMEESAFWEFY